jgi:hypothetical protein
MVKLSGPLGSDMAGTAEIVEERNAPALARTEALARPARDLTFRPEHFFLGRTEGEGVVRDPFGRVARRCAIRTDGAFSTAYGAIEFNETFAYDDGEVDIWRWAMTAGPDGRYVAAEAVAGAGIVGERRGDDYVLSFRRPHGRASGLLTPHFATRFTLLSAGVALKQATISILGLRIATMIAVHRRAGANAQA